ncbi:MAG TPA: hypothetical protein VFW49_14930 [Fluviicoccus sp.]|nr:hypothetical protein [Fluviicoccus sp.]
MSAEDYHDVSWYLPGSRGYVCKFCQQPITFSNRKPYNKDGTPHRCKRTEKADATTESQPQAALFAMAAMNAIINASIQAGGVDYIHHMNFYDVADAAWRMAAAMVNSEKNHRSEFGSEA